MQIKPINIKKEPEYPTEYLFINNPELFNNYMPLRWRANKVVSSALLAFILAGANANDSIAQSPKPKNETSIIKSKDSSTTVNEVKKEVCKVAPIFVHGDGTGVIGCVVESPPTFISEKEAYEIIKYELYKENIFFSSSNCPKIKIHLGENHTQFLQIDLINKEKNLLVEYISKNEIFEKDKIRDTVKRLDTNNRKPSGSNDLFDEDDEAELSVSSFNLKKSSEIVREELIKLNDYNAVIFYDPMLGIKNKSKINSREEYLSKCKETKDEAKELLTAQVRDFIQWMKNEGMIK